MTPLKDLLLKSSESLDEPEFYNLDGHKLESGYVVQRYEYLELMYKEDYDHLIDSYLDEHNEVFKEEGSYLNASAYSSNELMGVCLFKAFDTYDEASDFAQSTDVLRVYDLANCTYELVKINLKYDVKKGEYYLSKEN